MEGMECEMEVIYRRTVEGVDWAEMKETLNMDSFDNGRSVDQYRRSFENSFSTCIAYIDGRIIGTARVLSDGVGNAYMMDVWTLSQYRRQGIARRMTELLLEELEGQHVYLQTDDDTLEFYIKLGFKEQPSGMSIVVGEYLKEK
jgi:ribosomal protein S18 acetylase RimI-like enzyme